MLLLEYGRRVGGHRIEGSGGMAGFLREKGSGMRRGGRPKYWRPRREYFCGGGNERSGRRDQLGRSRMLSRDIISFYPC